VALKFKVAGKTDIGLVRSGNEDFLHLDKEHQVFAVCDGMGGHQAGEVASMTASQILSVAFDSFRDELMADPDLALDRSLPKSGELLLKSIRLANRQIYNKASANLNMSGMGTTVVAVALEGNLMSVAHVGDSRAYRVEERRLAPLTMDHSWVAEMRQKQMLGADEELEGVGKNVITRALGVRENVEIDYRLITVAPGDKFMLCSDGLCGFADDEDIHDVTAKSGDIERMCKDLVQLANDRGGADNVTVIGIEILETGESSFNEIEVFTLPAEGQELLDVEDRWLSRIDKHLQQDSAGPPSKSKGRGGGSSRFWLFLIFVLFIVVAFVVIKFMSTGE